MKKVIALLLFFFYTATNSCFAFSALYYFKGVNTTEIQPIVEESYNSQKYNVIKQNPYYAVSQSGDDAVVIILQQSGENMFYYYQSEDNLKVNKSVLKEIKKRGIVYEQSFNQNLIDVYDNIASGIISSSGAVKTYSFEEPEETVFTPPTQQQQTYQQPATYSGYIAQVASGTKIQCYLQNAINTATASKGDNIVAVVSSDFIYNGVVIAPQGSFIYGTLTTARHATYGSRNGRVVIKFNQIVTPDNKVYNISAETIDFTVSNEGKVKETLKNAAGTAVAGALAGLLFSLISGSDHVARSVAIGAGVGAGSSVIYSTAEQGVDAEIPSFTEIELTLTQPLSVTVGY